MLLQALTQHAIPAKFECFSGNTQSPLQNFNRKTHQHTQKVNQETQTVHQKKHKFVNVLTEPARNWIMVEINNQRRKIMIDTGAARTVMNLAMFKSLGLKTKDLNKTDINLIQADRWQCY